MPPEGGISCRPQLSLFLQATLLAQTRSLTGTRVSPGHLSRATRTRESHSRSHDNGFAIHLSAARRGNRTGRRNGHAGQLTGSGRQGGEAIVTCRNAGEAGTLQAGGISHALFDRKLDGSRRRDDFSKAGFLDVVLVSRHSNRGQNTDDRHDDHQFDQGKTFLYFTHFKSP